MWTYGTDTGTFAQVALHAFSGFTDGPENGTHFRFHWSPILALLWPIVAATRSPLSIQIVQVLLIAFAAVPLALLVRAYAGDKWALRVGILALIYPPLLAAAFDEFHELAFYPLLVLTMMWAADRARWLWFAIASFLLVLIREDVCVDLFFIGIALGIVGLLKRRSAQTGLLAGEPVQPHNLSVAGFSLAIASAGALAIYTFAILPHLAAWRPSHFYNYPFANGPLQTVIGAFVHPAQFGASMLTFGRLTYLVEAFAPLAFLPLRTSWTLAAVPGLVEVLLANDSMVWRMGEHYPLLWIPWLLIAAAWAFVRILRSRSERIAQRWWIGAIIVCTVVLVAFNPMHPAHYLTPAPNYNSSDIARAFACVPHGAQVATHDEWFSHEALAYPRVTDLTRAYLSDSYIVYATGWRNAYVDARILPQLDAAQKSGHYRPLCKFGSVVVLHAIHTAESRARWKARSRRPSA
jgi:uncharacterized membrane protein